MVGEWEIVRCDVPPSATKNTKVLHYEFGAFGGFCDATIPEH
jgi:hypothetical protein